MGPSGEKRSRNEELRPESDEDWLRYSPPPRKNNPMAEGEERAMEEKIVSRYASQIDGDCIPVTAPSGERVYAKICRVVREERLKKLEVKAQSCGRTTFRLVVVS